MGIATLGPDGYIVEPIVSPGAAGLPTWTATADEALPANSLVYIKPNGHCALADATAEGKEVVGFVRTAVLDGGNATIYEAGNIITGLAGLIPGTSYFMSTVPGAIGAAPAATGNVVQRVGTALSATELAFALYIPITL